MPTILREAVPSTIENVQTEYDSVSATVYDFTGKCQYILQMKIL